MAAIDQQLRKGVLEILVLRIIEEEDVYGYELIKKLESRSQGYFILKEGSLYPVMYRLEDQKYIEHYRQETDGKRGVPRKYYRITDAGRCRLTELLTMWDLFRDRVDVLLDREVR